MRILLVEHDEPTRDSLAKAVEHLGGSVVACADASRAQELLDRCDLDAVLCDLELPATDGPHLAARIHGTHPDVSVIVMSSHPEPAEVVLALRAGVVDFLEKPISAESLALALERAQAKRAGAERVRPLPAADGDHHGLIAGFVGTSPLFRALCSQILKAALLACPVLVTGEAGSGKGAVARALHREGPRAGGPFVVLSCAALPPELIEDELFGRREAEGGLGPGALAAASGGTLFLDEIRAMPERLQARLTRVLDVGTIPVAGGLEEVPVDPRIVASARSVVEGDPFGGALLPELASRLSAFPIEVPPLRARREDIPVLAQYFASRLCPDGNALLPESTLSVLAWQPFLANVRELEAMLQTAFVAAGGGPIQAQHLRCELRALPPTGSTSTKPYPTGLDLESVERVHILKVLSDVAGNRSLAARKLGMNRVTLYRKLKRFDLP